MSPVSSAAVRLAIRLVTESLLAQDLAIKIAAEPLLAEGVATRLASKPLLAPDIAIRLVADLLLAQDPVSSRLDVLAAPLLVGLPVALVGDDLGVVGVALALDVEHLPREARHRVALKSPLRARVPSYALGLQLLPAAGVAEGEVVERGAQVALLVLVPVLVGRAGLLVVRAELRPRRRLRPLDVHHLLVHHAHDVERTTCSAAALGVTTSLCPRVPSLLWLLWIGRVTPLAALVTVMVMVVLHLVD